MLKEFAKNLFGRKAKRQQTDAGGNVAGATEAEAFVDSKKGSIGGDSVLQTWNPVALPYTRVTDRKQTALVARSRDVILNTTDGKTASRIIRHNVVGEHGVRLQSQVMLPNGSPDVDANEAIEAAWLAYTSDAKMFDLAGENTLYDFQVQMINSVVTDGEAFLRMHRTDTGFGLKWSLIDPLRIPPGRSSFIKPKNENTVYKNGIIVEKNTNRRLQYAVNQDDIFRYSHRIANADFVPANEVFHAFIKEAFIGQMRGIPSGHTTFVNLYLMEKYVEAAVVNARVTAAKLGWLQRKNSPDNQEAPEMDFKVDEDGELELDEDGNPIPIDPMTETEISTAAGSINWLPDGYEFQGWNTDYPSDQFDGFTKVGNRKTASGFAIPYADLTGDLSDVNYSSIRQGALEIRENYKMLQKLIVWLLNHIYMEWLMEALMREMIVVKGRPLMLEDFEMYFKPLWTPRRWPWIDPQSEARANQIMVQSGLRSLSQIIREMGGDPDETWKSIKQDTDKMEAYGIPKSVIAGIFAEKGPSVEEILKELMNA